MIATVDFRVNALPVSLKMDRTSYTVGQPPLYTVTGPPNTEIRWSSFLNGASTGEVDTFYGHRADANGHWSGYGGTWPATGTWVKRVKLNGQTSDFAFTVTP